MKVSSGVYSFWTKGLYVSIQTVKGIICLVFSYLTISNGPTLHFNANNPSSASYLGKSNGGKHDHLGILCPPVTLMYAGR